MKQFNTLSSKMIPLPQNNVDTDQIIPARYLKVITKDDLAEGLFYDWRYKADRTLNPDFVLNKTEYQEAKIILAGDNFGCGSSREHAPWALMSWGIQAIISTSFADIFNNNALKNGLLAIQVDQKWNDILWQLSENNSDAELHIDLEKQRVTLPDESSFDFPISTFAKKCLLDGVDQLGYLLSKEEEINYFEDQRSKPQSIQTN
jgi:3-isopropylmalate/(R)-2-methylmalate dehydratase small subunit